VGKTGTLNGVTALAGYVFRKSSPRSPPYIFAFIANGRGKAFWQMKVLQNKMLETLINQ
jgi:D-alanyl-D-alanine carboxypeptidase